MLLKSSFQDNLLAFEVYDYDVLEPDIFVKNYNDDQNV